MEARRSAAKATPKAAATPTPAGRVATATRKPASRLLDERNRDVEGWHGLTLARMRALIVAAAPDVVEERKWKKPSNPAGVPVWSHHGIICTGETYAKVVKLTFAQGASLPDPARLFNSSLEGHTRRAIDIREGEQVEGRAFTALVKAAVAHNAASAKA
jgi:hypothetical protein